MVRGPWHRAGTLSNSTTKTSKWFKRALKTKDERWQLKPKTNLASRVLWSCFLLLHHRCLEMSITLQISASLLLDQPNFRKYRLGSRRFMIPFSFPSYTSYTEVSDAWPRFLLHVAFFPCPFASRSVLQVYSPCRISGNSRLTPFTAPPSPFLPIQRILRWVGCAAHVVPMALWFRMRAPRRL